MSTKPKDMSAAAIPFTEGWGEAELAPVPLDAVSLAARVVELPEQPVRASIEVAATTGMRMREPVRNFFFCFFRGGHDCWVEWGGWHF